MKKANVSQQEYNRLKAEGMTEKEVAAHFNISTATLYNHKNQWKDTDEPHIVQETNEEVSELKAIIAEKETLILDLQPRVSLLTDELNDYKNKLSGAMEKIKDLEAIHNACDDVESEIDSLQEEIKKLQKENEAFRNLLKMVL